MAGLFALRARLCALLLLAAPLVAAPAAPALAQADEAQSREDQGFVTRFLEENLSGAGRQVVLTGFQGALSSRATFDTLSIADEDGPWITLHNGAIQWNRSALLRRRVEIAELSAETIDLPRLPGGGDDGPAPEARDFALPDLPVALLIDKLSVDRVTLGEAVIGEAAVVSVEGAMVLSGGEGEARLSIQRRDDRRGSFRLHAGFANATRVLVTDLDLDEAEDGLLANLIGLHGRPSVKAQIHGEGPLSDFHADIALETDGQPRITGQVGISSAATADGSAADDGTDFRLRLSGDIAGLLPPERQAFFGSDTQLLVQGHRDGDGALSVPVMLIDTDALNLSGGFALNAQGAPESASLLMTLGEEAGATQLPVRLPLGDGESRVGSGRLELSYDRADGAGWVLDGHLSDLEQPDLTIAQLDLAGEGRVAIAGEALAALTGQIRFGAGGITPADPGLAAAIGPAIEGQTGFDWQPDNALALDGLSILASNYGLRGDLLLGGLSGGVTVSGSLHADHSDLSRLSALAGRPLSGATSAEISGHYTVLSRGFNIEARLDGQDLGLDQPQLDRLLGGRAAITLAARRDSDGIELSALTIDSARLSAHAEGTISSLDADLTATLRLESLADADAGLGGALTAQAHVTGGSDARRLDLNGEAMDLQIGIDRLDAALRGRTRLQAVARQVGDGIAVDALHLENPQLSVDGRGNLLPGQMDARIAAAAADLSAFDPQWSGRLAVEGTVTEAEAGRLLALTGTGEGLAFGDPRLDGVLAGLTRLTLRATQNGEQLAIDEASLTNDQISAALDGQWQPGATDLALRAALPSLRVMGPGYGGAITVQGSLTEGADRVRHVALDGTVTDLALAQNGGGAQLAGDTRLTLRASESAGRIEIETATIDNPRLRGNVAGRLAAGDTDLNASLQADSLAFIGRGIRGAVQLQAHLTDDGSAQSLTAQGQAEGLALGVAQLDPLLAGVTRLDLDAHRQGEAISLRRAELSNPQLHLAASGDLDDRIRVEARLNDLGRVVPELPGSLGAEGTLRRNGERISVDLAATGPGGARAQVAGSIRQDFSDADLRLTGTGEAAVANPFLRTRSVEGPVNFDLALRGRPGLEAVSGTVSLAGGRLADPKLGLRMDGLALDARLDRGRIDIDAGGDIAAGGHVAARGAVTLTGARPIDLTVSLSDVVLRDPDLYTTHADGQVAVTGTLGAGPLVSGTLRLSQTEIRIPSTGLGGAKDIPAIQHVHDRPPVRSTRARAGLFPWDSAEARAEGMSGPAATPPANPPRLDLTIEAPARIFIRGRGVDAEMGGRLRLTGRTDNVIPVGMFELIRGRVDLLGKRFNLTEGLLEMQGSMVPVIRLVAEASQDGILTRITIDGDARDPEITFSSEPDMPQEEVLSQLLFGRGLDKITPLQAAQLANAVAVLAGRGGEGIVGRLRQSVGLDDLDLATDDEGNVTLRAGKYLSENVYTDVAVGSDGTSTIQLNLDITDELTARGSVTSDGNSTVGLFYERDF